MESIRRAAAAYYENLPVANKRYARYIFRSMDKNGDGQINLKEYLEYLSKDNKTALAHPSLFRALDKNNNGSLDFEEVVVLYYITQSGRVLFCKSCHTFLTGVYFSCSQCFFKGDGVSTYEICCDCYGGKKFKHHDGAIFCDNYTMLSRSRRLALQASKEEKRSVVKETDMIKKAADAMKETLQAYIEQTSVVPEIDNEMIASIANLMSDAQEGLAEQSSVVGEIDYEMIASVANLTSDAPEGLVEQSSVVGEIDYEMIASVANLTSDAPEGLVEKLSSVLEEIDFEMIQGVADAVTACIIM